MTSSERDLDSWPRSARPLHRSAWVRSIGAGVGLVLLTTAILMVWRQREIVVTAVDSLATLPQDQWLVFGGVLITTVIANIVFTGIMFSILLKPPSNATNVGRAGWLEMQALIAASTLLNYVPLRPGLLGRVAYHRAYNNIPVADSIRAIVQAVVLSAVGAGVLLLAVLVSWAIDIPGWWAAIVPVPAWGAVMFTRYRTFGLAGLVRYADLLMTALRYFAAFTLLGLPIDSRGCLGFACISAISTMIPLFGSGLGLREWAVGVCSPILTANQMALGVTADLLNRAAELTVIVPAGLIGLAILARRRTRRG